MKKLIAVDTNILLDYRLQRQSGFKKAEELLRQCEEGKISLYIPSVVFPEVEWVFRSVYHLEKERIIDFLREIVDLKDIQSGDLDLLRFALELFFESRLSLTDCLILADVVMVAPDEFPTRDKMLQKYYKEIRSL